MKDLLGFFNPSTALILGSGWGAAAENFETRARVPYTDVPGLGSTAVEGHAGTLSAAAFEGIDLLVFEGRRHWYEGNGWEPVAIPVFLAKELGVSTLILTNAAGGVRADLRVGDLVVVDDHVNAMGSHPLIGPHDSRWGPRFPDQTEVYDRHLRALLDRAGLRLGEKLPHGVYLAASGPTYETPAEIAAFRAQGADVVGMSTVPEAILAHAAGMRVAAISCVTNLAAGLGHSVLNHADVIGQTARNRARMASLLTAFLQELGEEAAGPH